MEPKKVLCPLMCIFILHQSLLLMMHNFSNPLLGIFAMVSTIIITLVIGQSAFAQLPEIVFNNTEPQIEDYSNNTQKSSTQFLPEPILIASGQNGTHFVWEESVNGKSEIFYAKRTSDGFSYKTNLSVSSLVDSTKPSIMVNNGNIYFTWWESYDNGTQIPMFRASSDSGDTFGAITALSNIRMK